MGLRLASIVGSLMILVSGCATESLPGVVNEVRGSLQSIELFTRRPERGEWYPTAARECLFASDRRVYVHSLWSLPGPGDYVTKAILHPPDGSVYREREYRFRAEGPSWSTFQPFDLPQGEASRGLAGHWQVEVTLGGTPVGRRTFTLDPGSIRLRTDARLVVVHGRVLPWQGPGDWRWDYEFAALENLKATLIRVEAALRDELARRFPHVDGPMPRPEASDTAVLLTPTLVLSANPENDSRLELDIVNLLTKSVRKFNLKTSAGVAKHGMSGSLNFGVAGADLALRAVSNPEVLEFLISTTSAVPE